MENINVETIAGRVHLTPAPGYVLYDGKGGYSTYTILAVGTDETEYSAITEAEYEEILRAKAAEEYDESSQTEVAK